MQGAVQEQVCALQAHAAGVTGHAAAQAACFVALAQRDRRSARHVDARTGAGDERPGPDFGPQQHRSARMHLALRQPPGIGLGLGHAAHVDEGSVAQEEVALWVLVGE